MTPSVIVPSNDFAVPGPSSVSSPLLELQASATDVVRIQEMRVTIGAGPSNGNYIIGLGVPAIKGIGIGGIQPSFENKGDTSVAPYLFAYTAWSQLPAVPTIFLRRATLQAQNTTSIMGMIRFVFARGLTIKQSSSLVLWAISTIAATLVDAEIVMDG